MIATSDQITGPINLGNTEEVSILELAQTVIELTGARSKLVFLPHVEDDPRRRKPDISRASDLLGWEPSITLREGLLRTIVYFDDLFTEQEASAKMVGISRTYNRGLQVKGSLQNES
jgi:UDP-glucuronate decarboxylase